MLIVFRWGIVKKAFIGSRENPRMKEKRFVNEGLYVIAGIQEMQTVDDVDYAEKSLRVENCN